MKPHKFIHKYYVSKRDTHRKFSNTAFIIVFLALFAVTIFSLSAKADDKSKTEADSVCIDCVIDSLKPTFSSDNQFKDFKAINTAIFSKDPTSQTFQDPREEMDRSGPLNAIGLVSVMGTVDAGTKISEDGKYIDVKVNGTKVTGNGTGFLINDCLVLTNLHVPSLGGNSSKVKDLSISFSVGKPSPDGKSKFLLQSSGEVVDHGDYTGKNINSDWAIIKLNKPLGKTVGSIPLAVDGTAEQLESLTPLSSVAFYDDISDGSKLWGQKNCMVFKDHANPDQMKTSCPALSGTSGAPILFQLPGTDKVFAVGMIEGGHTEQKLKALDKDNANAMVPLFKAFSQSHLDEIKKKYQCPSSAAPGIVST